MTASPFELAATLAVLKYLVDTQIAGRQAQVSTQALGMMPPTTRLPVTIGGQVVASVSVPNPARRCKVTNPAKYLTWVQETRPEEVYDVPTIRQTFDTAVKASVKDHGGWLNKETGEYEPVPGLEQMVGDPYVKVELDSSAGDAIGQAWRDGLIDLRTVLALPAGGETDAA